MQANVFKYTYRHNCAWFFAHVLQKLCHFSITIIFGFGFEFLFGYTYVEIVGNV